MVKRNLSKSEKERFEWAIEAVIQNARENRHKRPTMTTLIGEMAEAILVCRGEHDDSLELEIVQMGGICINILRQLFMSQEDHVNNIGQGK